MPEKATAMLTSAQLSLSYTALSSGSNIKRRFDILQYAAESFDSLWATFNTTFSTVENWPFTYKEVYNASNCRRPSTSWNACDWTIFSVKKFLSLNVVWDRASRFLDVKFVYIWLLPSQVIQSQLGHCTKNNSMQLYMHRYTGKLYQ